MEKLCKSIWIKPSVANVIKFKKKKKKDKIFHFLLPKNMMSVMKKSTRFSKKPDLSIGKLGKKKITLQTSFMKNEKT